jgi:hypothetical protein
MSAWQRVTDPVRSLTVTMTLKCEHCSGPIPINGPARTAHCHACQRESPMRRLAKELALASEDMQQLGSPYTVRASNEAEPKCRKCEQVVPIAEWVGQTGASTTIACPGCGTGLPSYPAPAWLRERLPGIVQVFGGDPEVAVAEAGLALDIADEKQAKPIAMACPQCGGGLMITAADERVIECRFCTTSVFLPDELWRRLHPAKTMLAWTVTYTGTPLMTAEDLAEQQRQREAADRARAEREQAAAIPMLEPDAVVEERGLHVGWVLLGVALLVAGMVGLAHLLAG